MDRDRRRYASFLRTDQAFLFTGATLLGVLALASVAILGSGAAWRKAPGGSDC